MLGGQLILLVSLLADVLGLGEDRGLGSKQILGAILGIVVLLEGVWLWRRQRAASDTKG